MNYNENDAELENNDELEQKNQREAFQEVMKNYSSIDFGSRAERLAKIQKCYDAYRAEKGQGIEIGPAYKAYTNEILYQISRLIFAEIQKQFPLSFSEGAVVTHFDYYNMVVEVILNLVKNDAYDPYYNGGIMPQTFFMIRIQGFLHEAKYQDSILTRHDGEDIRKVKRAIEELELKGLNVNDSNIAIFADIPIKRVIQARNNMEFATTVPLDESLTAKSPFESAEKAAEQKELRALLLKVTKEEKISPRDLSLFMKSNTYTKDEKGNKRTQSIRSLAEEYNMSVASVKNIINNVMSKLKYNAELRKYMNLDNAKERKLRRMGLKIRTEIQDDTYFDAFGEIEDEE